MNDQNKNLILATVLSFIVIMLWYIIFPPPESTTVQEPDIITQDQASTPPAKVGNAAAKQLNNTALSAQSTTRIPVESQELVGSISLTGGLLDTLSLKKYKKSLEADSGIVTLFAPADQEQAYYSFFGWSPSGSLDFEDVPGVGTEWRSVGAKKLTPTTPITLQWDNGKGLLFTRKIAMDEHYMFTITQSVENTTESKVSLYPYGIIARHGKPLDYASFFISHEGMVGRRDGELEEISYDDWADLPRVEREAAQAKIGDTATDGWIGFTDKYWMSALIPDQQEAFNSVTKYLAGPDIYQTEIRLSTVSAAPGDTVSASTRLFAGAKEWKLLRRYMDGETGEQPIPGFVDAIDWGWFFFLTKPIFILLHWLNITIGNMGLAIIALTLIIKLMVLPLAYKSYVSMARMKKLQPEMEKIKERAGEDKQMLQREIMALYKEKKVNPAAGCLPILIQIPIFFSLYKVIFVTIELRQAPFFGWLRDLSQPDPSSFFNMFGLLPWAPPPVDSFMSLIFIGALPILLGVTMWLQQKLNPAPADPIQQQVFAWMPWVFMFMLGGFASGLVLYWIANNTITFAQQYMIMRSHGHTPDIFENIKQGFLKNETKPLKEEKKEPKASKAARRTKK